MYCKNCEFCFLWYESMMIPCAMQPDDVKLRDHNTNFTSRLHNSTFNDYDLDYYQQQLKPPKIKM